MPSRFPRTLALLAMVISLFASQARSLLADVRSVPAFQWVTDADVAAAHAAGNVLYLGGSFTRIGAAIPNGESFVDLAAGTVAAGCATRTGPQDDVRQVAVSDPTGGLFMQTPAAPEQLIDGAGVFALPPASSYARIGSDCRFDRSLQLTPFIAGDAVTRGSSVVRLGNVIYVAGTRPNGELEGFGRVVGYNSASGARTIERDFLQMSAVDIEGAMPDGRLLASIRLRGSIDDTRLIGALDMASGAFAQFATRAATGSLLNVVGTTMYLVANAGGPLQAIELTTGAPRAGWTNPTIAVNDLEVAAGRVFIAGSGFGRVGVFALAEASGLFDPAFAPVLGASEGATLGVERLVAVGTQLFLRGQTLRSAGGVARFQLAAIDIATAAVSAWAPLVFTTGSDSVDVLANGTRLFVGRVLSTQFLSRPYLAAVDTSTGVVLPFDPNSAAGGVSFIPPVTAIAANASTLFVGTTQSEIRRVSLGTELRDNWTIRIAAAGQAQGRFAALVATNSTLYAGGFFDQTLAPGDTQPALRTHALAVDLASGRLTSWNPSVVTDVTSPSDARAPVAVLALAGGNVVMGGAFSSAGGQPRSGLAAVDATSGLAAVEGFTLPAGNSVSDVAIDGNTVYFVGSDGTGTIGAASLLAGTATKWAVTAVAPTAAVAYLGGRVYSGPEWDVSTATPTTSPATWTKPFVTPNGLMELRDRPGGTNGPNGLRLHAYVATALPNAPTDLVFQVSGNNVMLAWAAPPPPDLATSYVVRAGSATGASNLADIDTGSLARSFATTAPDGTYFVRLHARNAFGVSPASNEVSFRVGPPPCTAVPSAPGVLSASLNGSLATLTWQPATAAASYSVEVGNTPGATNLLRQNVGTLTLVQTTAPPGIYYVRVRGVNACGDGPVSNELIVNVGNIPPAPGSPANLQAVVNDATVLLSWTAPTTGGAVHDYVLEAGTAPGSANIATTSTLSTALTVVNVPTGTYYVRIRARSGGGISPPTPDIVVVVR